jgi:serine protease Do
MMDELKIAELADKYFNGNLSQTEKELFILLVNSNEKYKQQFEQYKSLNDTFSHIALKKDISEILFGNKKSVDLKPRKQYVQFANYKTYAAAAVISLLVVMGTLLTTGYFKMNQEKVNSYTLLKNSLINISKRQVDLINSMAPERKQENYASGTCFPVGLNGYFITSLHLVKSSENAFLSRTGDTTKFSASVILKDSIHDIAILKISDTTFVGFKSLPFTFYNKEINIGEYVYTLGYSKNDIVFNDGSISSNTGYQEDTTAYQLSIPANPGNSGGPIVNSNGEIIGILLAKNPNVDNATFALKSIYINNLVQELYNDTLYDVVVPKKASIRIIDKGIKQIQPYIYKVEVY